MIPKGMTPEQFASIICQTTLAVEAVMYAEMYN
jgi:hypothetical protein